MDTIVTHLSVIITRANFVRTAGEAGQVAWRIPAASAAGIVRSGPGAGRDVRGGGSQTCRNVQNWVSSPPGQGLFRAPGAAARPGRERTAPARWPAWPCWPPPRCWPWPRPRRPRPRSGAPPSPPATSAAASSAAATASSHARCSNTSFLSEDSFNHDSTDYNIAGLFVRSTGRLEFSVDADITTATAALTLVVGSTSFVLADATTINTRSRYWSSSGVSLTAGTDITVKLTAPGTPNTAPTAANNTVTTGEDRGVRLHGGRLRLRRCRRRRHAGERDDRDRAVGGHAGARRHGGHGGRRRHHGPDRRRHAHLHARARCARRPLYDLHLHGERRHGRQRQRLHDDHRRDGRPRPRLRGARYRRRRPARNLDRHGDGGAV